MQSIEELPIYKDTVAFMKIELKNRINDFDIMFKYKQHIMSEEEYFLQTFKKEFADLTSTTEELSKLLNKLATNGVTNGELNNSIKKLECVLDLAKTSLSVDFYHYKKLYKSFDKSIKEKIPYSDLSEDGKKELIELINKIEQGYNCCCFLSKSVAASINIEVRAKSVESFLGEMYPSIIKNQRFANIYVNNVSVHDKLTSYKTHFESNYSEYQRIKDEHDMDTERCRNKFKTAELNLMTVVQKIENLVSTKIVQNL